MLQFDTYHFNHIYTEPVCFYLSRALVFPGTEIAYLRFVVFAGKPSRCKDCQSDLNKIRRNTGKLSTLQVQEGPGMLI